MLTTSWKIDKMCVCGGGGGGIPHPLSFTFTPQVRFMNQGKRNIMQCMGWLILSRTLLHALELILHEVVDMNIE